MNEWIMVAIVVVGLVIALGGGSWIIAALRGRGNGSTKG